MLVLNQKAWGVYSLYYFYNAYFLPINILEDGSKQRSLSFRLFGNLLAAEIVESVLYLLLPLLVPLPVMILGVFTSSLGVATLAGAYICESINYTSGFEVKINPQLLILIISKLQQN